MDNNTQATTTQDTNNTTTTTNGDKKMSQLERNIHHNKMVEESCLDIIDFMNIDATNLKSAIIQTDIADQQNGWNKLLTFGQGFKIEKSDLKDVLSTKADVTNPNMYSEVIASKGWTQASASYIRNSIYLYNKLCAIGFFELVKEDYINYTVSFLKLGITTLKKLYDKSFYESEDQKAIAEKYNNAFNTLLFALGSASNEKEAKSAILIAKAVLPQDEKRKNNKKSQDTPNTSKDELTPKQVESATKAIGLDALKLAVEHLSLDAKRELLDFVKTQVSVHKAKQFGKTA